MPHDSIASPTHQPVEDNDRRRPPNGDHLASITTFASASTDSLTNPTESAESTRPDITGRIEAKTAIYRRQAAQRELLPGGRVAWCYRAVGFNPATRRQHDHVHVKQSRKTGDYYTANLRRCDRWSECYVCWNRHTVEYLDRLLPLLVSNSKRFAYALETLTASHRAGIPLADYMARLDSARRKFRSGRRWQSFKTRWHLHESLTGRDLTHGKSNGWHYHTHTVLVADRGGFEVDLIDGVLWVGRHFSPDICGRMWLEIAPYWVECCEAFGLTADLEHGLQIEGARRGESTGAAAARYIAKLAMEVTRGSNKGDRDNDPDGSRRGRTIGQLLDDYIAGDGGAGRLWLEAQAALAGKHYLTASRRSKTSPGLWGLLDSIEPTETDLSAAGETEIDRILAALSVEDWRRILKAGHRETWFRTLAENSLESLRAFCGRVGVELVLQDDQNGVVASTDGQAVDSGGSIRVKRTHVDLDSLTFTETVETVSVSEYQKHRQRERDGTGKT